MPKMQISFQKMFEYYGRSIPFSDNAYRSFFQWQLEIQKVVYDKYSVGQPK